MDSGREQQDWFEKQTSSANTQHLPVIKASAMQLQRVNKKCTEEMSNTTAPLQGENTSLGISRIPELPSGQSCSRLKARPWGQGKKEEEKEENR